MGKGRALPFRRPWAGRHDEDPEMILTLADLFHHDPRLMDKVEAVGACWLWRGATQRSGSKENAIYGAVKRNGVKWFVHRWVYHIMVGRIPEGHDVHHRVEIGCTSTLCCNPAHLEDIEKGEHEWLHRELAAAGD